MRPTFEMLAFHLSRSWDIDIKRPKRSLGQLPLPLLYSPTMPLESGRIYVCHGADLPSERLMTDRCCFICCGGEPERHYKNSEFGLVTIEPSVQLDQVMNKVQCIYALYQDWEEELQSLVGSTTQVQELLDKSSLVLENLLCLSDENNDLLIASSQGKATGSADEYLTVFAKEAETEVVDKVSRQLADRSYSFDVMQMKTDDGVPEVYFINFFNGKIHIATLSMFPTQHKLQEHDKQLLEILALFVQIQLLRPSQISSESLRSIAVSLLAGGIVRDEEIAVLETILFFEAPDSYLCVVIRLPENVVSKSGIYLQRRIKVEASASISFFHEGDLVCLINATKSDWDSEQFYLSMKHCLGKTEFLAGVSDDFSALTDFKDHYREAKAIVQLSASDTSRLMTFADCWEPYVLSNCTGGLRPETLFTSGFKRLIEHNRYSTVDYIETLRVYIEEGQNDSRAATRLFICRNTFLYRLDKLKAVLCEELDNPDIRFRLELCLRLNDKLYRQGAEAVLSS